MVAATAAGRACVNIHSATSGLARLSTSWLRCCDLVRPAKWNTQSGCARYRSLSGFTISGSTHSPNRMPSSLTRSMSGPSPCGNLSRLTVQSPRPARSCAPLAEPAVVHHEELDAEPRGELGEPDLPGLVDVEPGGLPGVVEHRAQRRRPSLAAGPASCAGAAGTVGAGAAGAGAEAQPGAVRPGRSSPRPRTWASCQACHWRLAAPKPAVVYSPANRGRTSSSPGSRR